ncbi:hypothetical protein IMZ31_22650 (plasmid) [Pontibacillus sp. ALD_SL1]|uniref:hypothetical protein n=1 Tax=Pontibacillus sp. ALD_SL1 TaxID=2777185 RepID=UPI001A965E7B|nr:hypothetical protein [Pontibacillus sp. ALD_SL1]QST02257.1 hypothetical protein IMZ31_22650 [Pontibacillus sp. ALD_SL1]
MTTVVCMISVVDEDGVHFQSQQRYPATRVADMMIIYGERSTLGIEYSDQNEWYKSHFSVLAKQETPLLQVV